MVIQNEQLFFEAVEENIIMVDNYRNEICTTGAFLALPKR